MSFCYDDSVKADFTGVDMSKINATKCYLTHVANNLYLSFMAKEGTLTEKFQAEKELIICDRKMTYWQKHSNFEKEAAQRGAERLIKEWSSRN